MGVMSERDSMLRQRTNEYGFPQTYLEEEGQAPIPCVLELHGPRDAKPRAGHTV